MKWIALLGLLATGAFVTGCNERETRLDDRVEATSEEAYDDLRDASEEAGERMRAAGERVGEGLDETGEEIQAAAD